MTHCPQNGEVMPGLIVDRTFGNKKQRTHYSSPGANKRIADIDDCVARTTAESAQEGSAVSRRICRHCGYDVQSAMSRSTKFNRHHTRN